MNRTFSKIELGVLVVAAVLGLIVLPALHAEGLVSPYRLAVWGKYLCFAVLAISVNLLWGFTGLLSLGQALFFALGGYMLGMHLMLLGGPFGQYAQSGQNPAGLPDFMVFLGHTFLPWFWKPFGSFGFALAMVVLVPGLLAWVFGWLAFRSRVRGVYFSILTQALTYGAALMFFRNDLVMGGNNGFTDFKLLLGQKLGAPGTQRGLWMATVALLLAVYAGSRWLTGTKFGLVQRAVRDSETRALFSGYPVARYKGFVFVVSAIIAALGGALYVPQVGIINPSEMTPDKSLEAVVWVAVGGRGTLLGPIVGAVGVNALKSWATRAMPDAWLLLLGGMFILAVLFLPKGIVGTAGDLLERRKKPRAREQPADKTPAKPTVQPEPALP